MRRGTQPAVILGLLLFTSAAQAQAERYELGCRLKRFEQTWETQTDPGARTRALSGLPKVTNQFFSFQLGEAGRTLDEATFALQGSTPSQADRWLIALSLRVPLRVLDAQTRTLSVEVAPFYQVPGSPPAEVAVTVRVGTEPAVPVPLAKFPAKLDLKLPEATQDTTLSVVLETKRSGKLVSTQTIPVDRIRDLKARLASLQMTARENRGTTLGATIQAHADQIDLLAEGVVSETDLPALRLLNQAEQLAREPGFSVGEDRQNWLTLALARKQTAAVRLFVPKGLDAKKPVPVVVALHGAGGSENLFFEGYGNGQIVKECEKRGWVLIAPRSGLGFVGGPPPVRDIVDQLATMFPLDSKRVLLVGHSMGASQAVEAAQQQAGMFRAVALLGGSGRVRTGEAFRDVPVLVGVGSKDFALNGARSLHKALIAAGAKQAQLKEYPDVEHMVIVRVALPEVFALFEASLPK